MKEQTAAQQPALIGNELVLVLYAGMLLFFLYLIYKGYRAKKHLQDPQYAYTKAKGRWINIVLVILMTVMGAINLYMHLFAEGGVMLALALTFTFSMNDKIIIAQNGIYGENRFTPWDQVKKWGWNKETGDLILVTKERGKQESSLFFRIGKDQMLDANQKIRELKLKKGSKA